MKNETSGLAGYKVLLALVVRNYASIRITATPNVSILCTSPRSYITISSNRRFSASLQSPIPKMMLPVISSSFFHRKSQVARRNAQPSARREEDTLEKEGGRGMPRTALQCKVPPKWCSKSSNVAVAKESLNLLLLALTLVVVVVTLTR